MHFIQKENTKALEFYLRGVAIYEKIGKESISWADTLNIIGELH
jgi:hypothetical protein